jgi:glycosyltransferase involved in cell wall biosynthesis
VKIIQVNHSDISGGAARAAYRLHKGLLAQGVNSQMLVQSKISDDFTVIGSQTKLQKAAEKIRPMLDSIPVHSYKDRAQDLFSPSWVPFSGLVDKINELNPDVVQLHWITSGMMSIKDLSKIKAPIVWSLHDMWAFTGGCHYDQKCGGYKKLCGDCPILGSKNEKDLSRKVWLRKKSSFAGLSNMTIVGPSKWMAECAASSSLFQNNSIVNLPNPIDTQIFSPFCQAEARKLLNLPLDKKIILFGAMGATSDPRKGFKELAEALDDLPRDYVLVVFGSGAPQTPQGFKQKTHYLGRLQDEVSLRILYSAADVMVVPSLQENLSNVIMESLACGTPVVGFSIGGNGDLIEHRKNGYLAKPFDKYDLTNGINWILQNENPTQLAQAAREKVMLEFDSILIAKKYIELYDRVSKSLL